ncbi:MAG: nucleotide sugar dehydrogenase [Deltaproteobacteria bacterium]|nr:nucleotide sugar dehydrogenase [Deltaproteobacteria bacterium]
MTNSTQHKEHLLAKIEDKSVLVGVIGLGYVGLPLSLTFVEKGIRALGFDVDTKKITAIEEGVNYVKHLPEGKVKDAVANRMFEATTDFARLKEVDVAVICVPTPLNKQRDPDLSYVKSTAHAIGQNLQKGQLVVLESTTFPGTTDEIVCDILEDESGLKSGDDFFLAFSPEREDPGNKSFNTAKIPKVVGGTCAASGEVADALYKQAVTSSVLVSSSRVAEAAKLTENIFRAVNIALVNELKVVYDKMGIDVWEVLDAADTKPFGFMRFNPGPGWGGHCIPLDPFYLSYKAREYGVTPKFIELAGEVNVDMPVYVIDKLQEALNKEGKAMNGAKVMMLGIAYKKDIDDPRESPAFELLDQLLAKGVKVTYHDPHIAVAPRMRSWPDLPTMESQPLTDDNLKAQDAVMVVTDHTAIDWGAVEQNSSLIIDTRGVYRAPRANVVKA